MSTPGMSSDTGLSTAIRALKQQLGPKVCIMGHHYQAQEVVDHCDIVGDSLELARKVADVTAPHIVFCGVYFMGESAVLLATPEQKVYLPDTGANCVMSLMTPAERLEALCAKLAALPTSGGKPAMIPLAYVNTSLAVKAVVGRYGGAVCTSANASTMLQWALDSAERVLFLPDKNLARNVARDLGLDEGRIHQLDIRKNAAADLDAAAAARLLLWPGCCAVHAKFAPQYVAKARQAWPGCTIVVHPECSPETVRAVDAAGSTSFIIKYAEQAVRRGGGAVVIGTESNLVERLRARHQGRGVIVRLRDAFCSHMGKVTAAKLHATLAAIAAGTATPLSVTEADKAPARASLQRMLDACARAGV